MSGWEEDLERVYNASSPETQEFIRKIVGEQYFNAPDVGGGGFNASRTTRGPGNQPLATADVSGGLYSCPTCGENVTRYGRRCDRCTTSLEHDRLERESGR